MAVSSWSKFSSVLSVISGLVTVLLWIYQQVLGANMPQFLFVLWCGAVLRVCLSQKYSKASSKFTVAQ